MTAVSIALVLLLAAAALAALAFWLWRRPVAEPPRRQPWDGVKDPSGAAVVLDLTAADPDDPAVQRLVHETAAHALRSDPSLDRVEVVDAYGTVLGREHRATPLRDVALPDELHEPHVSPSRAPSVVRPTRPRSGPRVRDASEVTVAALPLADRLSLTPAIRGRIMHPDRAVDVLAAVLEASGRPATVDGDLVISGDVAIAVVDPHTDAERALTHAFLRIQATRAPRGIVLRLGHVDPRAIRRREAAAPHVRHVGPDALQRMADAAAAGADPIAFAAAPAIRR